MFQGPQGAENDTDRPVVKTAFLHLGAIWPGVMPFSDLLTLIRSHLGHDERGRHPRRDLQEALQHLADELEANLTTLGRLAMLVA